MFFGKIGKNMKSQLFFPFESCSPWIDISNEVLCASNGDRMPNYNPGKLIYQFTQTGPIVLALHLLGIGFWIFRLSIVSNNK